MGNRQGKMKYYATVNDQEYVIEIDQDHEIVVNGERYAIDFQQLPEAGMASLLLENRSLEAVVDERSDVWDVLILGDLYSVKVQDERTYRLAQARGTSLEGGDAEIRAPMPGIVIALPVAEGDVVRQGDKVVILESMKMENELRAPRDGVIIQVRVVPGTNVDKGQVLAMIGDLDEEDE